MANRCSECGTVFEPADWDDSLCARCMMPHTMLSDETLFGRRGDSLLPEDMSHDDLVGWDIGCQ